MEIVRPRVRTVDNKQEVALPTYEAAQKGQIDLAAVETACIAGVSQRDFGSVAQALVNPPPDRRLGELSKGTVGRRFIRATRRQLEKLNQRRLDGQRVLVLYMDGVNVGGRTVLAALGLLDTGEKRVLGLRDGSTENGEVCREFLQDLVARGLSAEKGLLAVVDGGKAIISAVHAVFGPLALIQRCQVHKKRNVLDKLPSHASDHISRRLSELWSEPSPSKARRGLESLAGELALAGHHEAGASLREGLPETLTVHDLGLPSDGTLIQSLTTTNPIESMFSIHEQVSHRVKNWKNGEMVRRWVAAALLEAEKSFKTVATSQELQQLAAALEAHAGRVRTQPAVSFGEQQETA